ncbi:hypothetical protein QZH41_018088, partial [Actinostola sp. cb2023]
MPEYRDQIIGECFGPDNNDSAYSMTASGARALLLWSRQQTEGYNDVNIYNMTSSWQDGLAFCAIIHRYRPDLIEFDKLSKDSIAQNNELAFDICERLLDIPSILDVRDMVENSVPDKLSILTFVSQLFNCFKDKIPANQVVSTKMNPSTKSKSELSLAGKGKRASHQIYALHGKAKKFSSALKNVFKSDTKDDRLKVEDTLAKHSSNENLKIISENEKKVDNTTSPALRQPIIGTTCYVCHHKVFILERVVVEHKLFHRACFKCSKCDSGLRPGTYAYCSDTEKFCCVYECMGDFKKTQEEIRIKLQPITDKVFDVLHEASQTTSVTNSSKSTWSSGTQGNTLGPPFSIVKKNAISIGSLQKSFQNLSSLRNKRKRPSKDRKGSAKDRRKLAGDREPKIKKVTTTIEVEVKRENGKVSINQTKQASWQTKETTSDVTDVDDNAKVKSTWKEKTKGPVGLNDAYSREEEEKPQEGSVNKLRMKFMNIDDMIEDKHRQKVAKKNERIQREIRRVVPTWNEQANAVSSKTTDEEEAIDGKNSTETRAEDPTRQSLESEESSESLGTSSGQSTSSQMDGNYSTRSSKSSAGETKKEKYNAMQNRIVITVSNTQNDNNILKNNSNHSVNTRSNLPVQNSSSSSTCSTPSPTSRTIPIIVKPSIDYSDMERDEREHSHSQTSSTPGILSPDSSISEPPNSPMSSIEEGWSSQTSLTETNSGNLSKMSIIIAQEASSTKVNSRYFTVETCEGKDRNVITEDKELETVDIEGEFRFGDEGSKYTKAQQDVLRSLSNCKITREKSDLVNQEEVFLSPLEIMDELNALGILLTELEKRGVEMEKLLRHSMTSEHSLDNEDELVREWLTLVQEKNIITRRESELIYLIKFHQYEDRYLLVECELRSLLSIKDETKTLENVKRERELMAELFSLVQRRSSIVDRLEEDRLR